MTGPAHSVVGRAPRHPPPGGYAPEPPTRMPSVRAALGLLVISILLTGLAYPLAVVGFANAVSPNPVTGAPLGSTPSNASASALIGENISNASLFWLRPSLLDWQAVTGSGESPYGPTDPSLRSAINATIAQFGLTNETPPIDLLTPSDSGLDPDLSTAAVLIQVPRVAAASNLSQAFLTGFVEQHVLPPLFGFLGPSYVNVIALDIDLIAGEGS